MLPHDILLAAAAYLVLQVLIIALLQLIAALRKRRKPIAGFPYLHLPETGVGENSLRIYSRGQELFDAMIAAVEHASGSISLSNRSSSKATHSAAS
jgi:hypothetical protein